MGYLQRIVALGIAALAAAPTRAEVLSTEILRGEIREKGQSEAKPLFRVETRLIWNGPSLVRAETIFRDTEERPAVSSFEDFDAAGQLVTAQLVQHQLDEEGLLERKDGQANFRYVRGLPPDRKTKEAREMWPDNLVLGSTLLVFLRAHWEDVLAGKSLDVRFAVFERTETFGFRLTKVEEKRLHDRDVVLVKMRPISFLVAQVVDPIELTLDREDQTLLRLVGQTGPKRRQSDGTWADFDADITYRTEFPPTAERARTWGTSPL